MEQKLESRVEENKNKVIDKARSLGDLAKHWVVDNTGLMIASHPIYAGVETMVSGLDVGVSIDTRINVTKLSFLGLGIAYAKGRDITKKLFGIDKNSPKKVHGTYDAIYGATFALGMSIPLYLHSGATLKETLIGGTIAAGLSTFISPITGYTLDTFRDFVGTKKPERQMPKWYDKIGQGAKRLIAAEMIVGMLTLTNFAYDFKDKYASDWSVAQKVEEAIKNSRPKEKLEEIASELEKRIEAISLPKDF